MRAILQSLSVAAGLAVVLTTTALAAEVAPTDVKFNDSGAVETPMTDTPGDPANGRKVFVDRRLGNCLACHQVNDLSDQLFHGNVGPELNGVAGRYDTAQLRGIVANSKMMFTKDTVMPGFYSLDVGAGVRKESEGKTIISAQEVEDVVAYLGTLK